MGRGVHRGFITHEELSKSLGKRNLSGDNLAQAFIHILNEKIILVQKKSDFKVLRKKENSSKEEGAAAQAAEGDGKAPPADAAKSEKKEDAKKGDDKKSQPEKK